MKSNDPEYMAFNKELETLMKKYDVTAHELRDWFTGNCPFVEDRIMCDNRCVACPGNVLCECGSPRFLHYGGSWIAGNKSERTQCDGFKPKHPIAEVFR